MGNIVIFRKRGGTIISQISGRKLDFKSSGGIYKLKATTSAREARRRC